jgi:release factor glutamine methyltransferase
MNPIVAAARRLAHEVWYRRARAAFEQPDECSLFGLDLLVTPGVLHPGYFLSSRVLAEQVLTLDLRDRTVLDLGTGSGIQALLAARGGAQVTAVDISQAAVDCAAENARRNGLADGMTVLASDLFEKVLEGLRFDLVITNPPFYSRTAANERDLAFAGGAANTFFEKLSSSLPGRLEENGALVMIQSSDADFGPIERMLEARGLRASVLNEKRGLFETLTVREFRPAPE